MQVTVKEKQDSNQ